LVTAELHGRFEPVAFVSRLRLETCTDSVTKGFAFCR
jgi:hypothetical protein